MTLLGTYIMKEFARLLGAVIACLVGIYLIVEFFERIDDFIQHDTSVSYALSYFLYKLPLIVYQVAPVSALFPTVLLITRWTRSGEITATKAIGINLFRLTSPLLAMSLLMSVFVLSWGEFVVAPSMRRLDRVNSVISKGEGSTGYQQSNMWFKTGRNDIWHIALFKPLDMVMKDVVVFSFDANRTLKSRVDARLVVREDGRWRFHEAYVRNFSNGQLVSTRFFQSVVLPLDISPSELRAVSREPERIRFRELAAMIKRREALGLQSTSMVVDMHSKLSYPLSSFVMVLLGIPLSLGWERGGKLSWGILLGIMIGVLYWLFFFMGISLGHNGLLPALPAAWGANILLSLVGLYMMLGARL